MTADDINAMPASHELNSLVARRLGLQTTWRLHKQISEYAWCGGTNEFDAYEDCLAYCRKKDRDYLERFGDAPGSFPVPTHDYSSDIKDAFRVPRHRTGRRGHPGRRLDLPGLGEGRRRHRRRRRRSHRRHCRTRGLPGRADRRRRGRSPANRIDAYSLTWQPARRPSPGMRYQTRPGACGAAAVVNALRAFGKRVSERTVRKLAGTTYDGTDEYGIMVAVRALGFAATPFEDRERHHAWRWLHGALAHGAVAILNGYLCGHWIVCIGLVGERVIVIDSTRTRANQSENGVHVLTKDRLLQVWRSSKSRNDNVYYAICVGRTK